MFLWILRYTREPATMHLLLAAGALATAYGMIRPNNLVFVAGVAMGTAGYLLLRRRLKKARSEDHQGDRSV